MAVRWLKLYTDFCETCEDFLEAGHVAPKGFTVYYTAIHVHQCIHVPDTRYNIVDGTLTGCWISFSYSPQIPSWQYLPGLPGPDGTPDTSSNIKKYVLPLNAAKAWPILGRGYTPLLVSVFSLW